jgi:four helix bundle protein
MSIEDLKNRFKKFAIEVAMLIQKLPKNTINNAYCNQLIRCSSSSAANYRAACRAKSPADFINKLKIVEEEIDESSFFLELLQHFNSDADKDFSPLLKEAKELLAIVVKSIKTVREKQK